MSPKDTTGKVKLGEPQGICKCFNANAFVYRLLTMYTKGLKWKVEWLPGAFSNVGVVRIQ